MSFPPVKISSATLRERVRVNELISRDIRDRDQERFRLDAIIQVENGDFTNIQSTVLSPTREQLEKHEFNSHPTAPQEGTVRPRNTVRRVSPIQISTLRVTGVLDDDLYAACNWYRNTYEKTGWETLIKSSSYAEGGFGGGSIFYGHLPKTQRAAESRDDFRMAQAHIPKDYGDVFNAVVIMDSSLTKQAELAQCRLSKIRSVFLGAALALHGGIAAILEIEPRVEIYD